MAPQSWSLTLNPWALSSNLVRTRTWTTDSRPNTRSLFSNVLRLCACISKFEWLECRKGDSYKGACFSPERLRIMMGILAYLVPSSFPVLITRDITTPTPSECWLMGAVWLPLTVASTAAICEHDNSAVGKAPGPRMPHRGRARWDVSLLLSVHSP